MTSDLDLITFSCGSLKLGVPFSALVLVECFYQIVQIFFFDNSTKQMR